MHIKRVTSISFVVLTLFFLAGCIDDDDDDYSSSSSSGSWVSSPPSAGNFEACEYRDDNDNVWVCEEGLVLPETQCAAKCTVGRFDSCTHYSNTNCSSLGY